MTEEFLLILKRRLSGHVSRLLVKQLYEALNQPSVLKNFWEQIGAPTEFDSNLSLKENLIVAYGLEDIENAIVSISNVENHRAFFEAFLSPSREIEAAASDIDFVEKVESVFERPLKKVLEDLLDVLHQFESEIFAENFESEVDPEDWRARDRELEDAWNTYYSSDAYEESIRESIHVNHIDGDQFDEDEMLEKPVIQDRTFDELVNFFIDYTGVDSEFEEDDEGYITYSRRSMNNVLEKVVEKVVEKAIQDVSVVLQTKLSFIVRCDPSNNYSSGGEIIKHLSNEIDNRLFSKLRRTTKIAYECGVDLYLAKLVQDPSRQIEFVEEEAKFVIETAECLRRRECFIVIHKSDNTESGNIVLDLLPRHRVSFDALRILLDYSLSAEVVTPCTKLQIGPVSMSFYSSEFGKQRYNSLRNMLLENVAHENTVAIGGLHEVTREITFQTQNRIQNEDLTLQKIVANNCISAEICFVDSRTLCLDIEEVLPSRQGEALTFTAPCEDVEHIYVSPNSLQIEKMLDVEFGIKSFERASYLLGSVGDFTSRKILADRTEDGRRAAYIFSLEAAPPRDAKEIPFSRNLFAAEVSDAVQSNFKSTTFYPKAGDLPEAPTRFMNYIGFKNPQNGAFYKDSNYLPYIYLYMYMPQVVNRFKEHLQDDKISQQAPLAAAMNCYISVEIADNPQRFLREALELAKKGHHPLYKVQKSSRHFQRQPLVKFSELMSTEQQERKYHVLFGYMYSLCDYYTRPLSILYNALWAKSSETSARVNPLLREDVRNLAGNFDISKFVESYRDCINASQDADFVRGSRFNDLTSVSATLSDIERELDYFVENARVWEYNDLEELYSIFDTTPTEELPSSLRPEKNAVLNESVLEYMSQKLPDAEVFLDAHGETKHTRFSKELTFCLSVLSKFWTFTMGPMLTDGFYSGPFWKKFIEGSMPNVVSHIVNISELFNFAVWSNSLNKIKKDDLVKVTGGGQERLSQTNKVKNVIPYAGIRDALRKFDRKPEYSYLGLDGSMPKASRLSLGAFISVFSWIRYAEKHGVSSAIEFGALQTDMEVLKVYQPAFDAEEGYEDSPSKASSDDITKRLERLSAKFTICIGENSEYIEDAIAGKLEVFTFMSPEGVNLSTLGLYENEDGFYAYDAKGQNNGSPEVLGGIEQHIAMIKWFEGLVFKYCVEEADNDLKDFVQLSIADDEAAKDFEFNKKGLDLDDSDGFIKDLFTSHGAYLPLDVQTIEQACGVAQKTTELLHSALPRDYTQEQLDKAKQALIYAGEQIGCNFFELLFESKSLSKTDKVKEILDISKKIDRASQENFTPEIRRSF